MSMEETFDQRDGTIAPRNAAPAPGNATARNNVNQAQPLTSLEKEWLNRIDGLRTLSEQAIRISDARETARTTMLERLRKPVIFDTVTNREVTAKLQAAAEAANRQIEPQGVSQAEALRRGFDHTFKMKKSWPLPGKNPRMKTMTDDHDPRKEFDAYNDAANIARGPAKKKTERLRDKAEELKKLHEPLAKLLAMVRSYHLDTLRGMHGANGLAQLAATRFGGKKVSELTDAEIEELSPLTPAMISADLFQPLVRQGIMPEAFVPAAYSEVAVGVSRIRELYDARLEKATAERSAFKEKWEGRERLMEVASSLLQAAGGAAYMSAGVTVALVETQHISRDTGSREILEVGQRLNFSSLMAKGLQFTAGEIKKEEYPDAFDEFALAIFGAMRIGLTDKDGLDATLMTQKLYQGVVQAGNLAYQCHKDDPQKMWEAFGDSLAAFLRGLDKDPITENLIGKDKGLFGDEWGYGGATVASDAIKTATFLAGMIHGKIRETGSAGDLNRGDAWRFAGKFVKTYMKAAAKDLIPKNLGTATDDLLNQIVEDEREELAALEALENPTPEDWERIKELRNGDIEATRKDVETVIGILNADSAFSEMIVGGIFVNATGKTMQKRDAAQKKAAARAKEVMEKAHRDRATDIATRLLENTRQNLLVPDEEAQRLLIAGFTVPTGDGEEVAQAEALRASSMAALTERLNQATMIADLAKNLVQATGGLTAAMVPGGLMAASAGRLMAEMVDTVRFFREFDKWVAIYGDVQGSASITADAVMNRHDLAKRQRRNSVIKDILYAIELIGEAVRVANGLDGGAGVMITGAARVGNGLMDAALKVKTRSEMSRAWAIYKEARRDPRNRKLARKAIRENPTLAKYALAYGAVEGNDPFARSAVEKLGISEVTLADPGTDVAAVQKYLELRYPEDPVIEYDLPDAQAWYPAPLELTAKSWVVTLAAAQNTVNFAKFTGNSVPKLGKPDVRQMAPGLAAGSKIAAALAAFEAKQDKLGEIDKIVEAYGKVWKAGAELSAKFEQASDDAARKAVKAKHQELVRKTRQLERQRTERFEAAMADLSQAIAALDGAPRLNGKGEHCIPLETFFDEFTKLVEKRRAELAELSRVPIRELVPQLEDALEDELEEDDLEEDTENA